MVTDRGKQRTYAAFVRSCGEIKLNALVKALFQRKVITKYTVKGYSVIQLRKSKKYNENHRYLCMCMNT